MANPTYKPLPYNPAVDNGTFRGLLTNDMQIAFRNMDQLAQGLNAVHQNGINGVVKRSSDFFLHPEDSGSLVVCNSSSAISAYLPNPVPASSWFVLIQNAGTGVVTVKRNGLTIDDATADVDLQQNQGLIVVTNNVNYYTERGVQSLAAQQYPFASLPTASLGMVAVITDSTVVGWGNNVTVGGGGNKVLAWYNGTHWTVVGA